MARMRMHHGLFSRYSSNNFRNRQIRKEWRGFFRSANNDVSTPAISDAVDTTAKFGLIDWIIRIVLWIVIIELIAFVPFLIIFA